MHSEPQPTRLRLQSQWEGIIQKSQFQSFDIIQYLWWRKSLKWKSKNPQFERLYLGVHVLFRWQKKFLNRKSSTKYGTLFRFQRIPQDGPYAQTKSSVKKNKSSIWTSIWIPNAQEYGRWLSHPFEKYARQNGFIFPNFRGKNSRNAWNHHL